MNDRVKISSNLVLAEILARSAGHELFAAGTGKALAGDPGAVHGHRFAVSSLDSLREVQVVLTGADADDLLVALRPPGASPARREALLLRPEAGGRWVWRGVNATFGDWWLELYWRGGPERRRREIEWGYQAWGSSRLRAHLNLEQWMATGTALTGDVRLIGADVRAVVCSASLRGPAGSVDALICRQMAKDPRIALALAAQRRANWPDDDARPWWRLGRAHKLAALASVDPRLASRIGEAREKPTMSAEAQRDGSFVLRAAQAAKVAGVYTARVRLTGQVGEAEGDRFEREIQRQVFANPVPVAAQSSFVVVLVNGALRLDAALWDAFGNPVLSVGAGVTLKGVEGKPLARTDGRLSWDLGPVRRPDRATHVSVTLKLGERGLVPEVQVPLPGEATPRPRRADLREEVVRAPAQRRGFVSVLTGALDGAVYVVEVVRADGKVVRLGEGRGARRFALPRELGPRDEVRVRSVVDDESLDLEDLRFD